MKYFFILHKYTYIHHIKREMSSFKINLWENTMFINSWCRPDGSERKLNISMMLSLEPKVKPRKIIMCRKPDDTICMLMERIKLKLKMNKVSPQKVGRSDIVIKKDGVEVCIDDTLSYIFERDNADSTLTLVIKGTLINIVYNAPMLNNLKLSEPPYENLMLYPYGFHGGHNVSSTHTKFYWYRITLTNKEIEVGCQIAYTPTAEDVDCCLKLVCEPYNEKGEPGPIAEILSSKVVQNTIKTYPYENRLKERDISER